MLKVDIINCKTKSLIIAYLFILVITSKIIIIDNINVFEELNIN